MSLENTIGTLNQRLEAKEEEMKAYRETMRQDKITIDKLQAEYAALSDQNNLLVGHNNPKNKINAFVELKMKYNKLLEVWRVNDEGDDLPILGKVEFREATAATTTTSSPRYSLTRKQGKQS